MQPPIPTNHKETSWAVNGLPRSVPFIKGNKRVGNFSAPSSSQSLTKKLKSPEVSVGAAAHVSQGMKNIPRAAKIINYLTFQTRPETQALANNSVANESSDLTSTVAKCCLIDQTCHLPAIQLV